MINNDTKEIDSIIIEKLAKLASGCERMQAILRQATEPPSQAWFEALRTDGTELHATLSELLGIGTAADSPVEEAVSFLCDQLEKTFQRLGEWKDRGCPAGEI